MLHEVITQMVWWWKRRSKNMDVLSIATKMVPRPRFSEYIRMVEDTCWPPSSLPASGVDTILVTVAIESTGFCAGALVTSDHEFSRFRSIPSRHLIYIHHCVWLGLFVDRWWWEEVSCTPDFVKTLYSSDPRCSKKTQEARVKEFGVARFLFCWQKS